MLGPVQAVSDQGPLPLGGPKPRALLAELLLERGRLVPRERLVDALWGERPPASAHASLQVYVHGLRRALGSERITTTGSGYRIRLERGELDVERFEQLLARADRALAQQAPAAALDDLDAALALWRGPPLADVRDQPFAAAAVPRLEELRFRAFELRGDALLALGEHDALLPDLERLIAEHPYRERLREQHLLALYRAGRQTDALAAYRATRETLLGDLGVDPGPALQELERAILTHDPALAPPSPESATPVRLPVPATPLVGRRLETAVVEGLLRSEARLVTLTGPGGTGKTRLALAVAEQLGAELRDGACFIDASAVTTAAALLPAVARALAVEGPDEEVATAIADHLRDRSMLLVVDNLEQLGRETQPIAAILSAAPRVRVLATSRVPLHLSGEHDYPVPPLPVPARSELRFEELVANDAVRLFAARARAVDPSFALSDHTIGPVVAVCRRLDGLPLALELAATWIKALAPQEIERRLGRALELLVQGARDLPPRQQTLRATLDWSHELLAGPEQRLLAELSVFAGGWTVGSAEAVLGEGCLPGLASLVDHSLVRRRGDRFTMLETIREYAAEKLGASDLPDRHCRHFVAVAERGRAAMIEGGDAEAAAFELFDTESENLEAALERAHETGNVDEEARIAVGLRWYWVVRGRFGEGKRVFERLAAASAERPAVLADALSGAGVFNYRRADRELAVRQLETARALYAELGNDDETARCLAELGAIAVDDGDLARAARLFTEAGAAFDRLGNPYRFAVALGNLAAIEVQRGNLEAAAGYSHRSIELQRSLGDTGGLGVSLANLARVQLKGGDVEAARLSLREAFEVALRIDYKMLIAYLLGSAGDLRQRSAFGRRRCVWSAPGRRSSRRSACRSRRRRLPSTSGRSPR